eukprot:6476273-Amphidinium_carterae.2
MAGCVGLRPTSSGLPGLHTCQHLLLNRGWHKGGLELPSCQAEESLAGHSVSNTATASIGHPSALQQVNGLRCWRVPQLTKIMRQWDQDDKSADAAGTSHRCPRLGPCFHWEENRHGL